MRKVTIIIERGLFLINVIYNVNIIVANKAIRDEYSPTDISPPVLKNKSKGSKIGITLACENFSNPKAYNAYLDFLFLCDSTKTC